MQPQEFWVRDGIFVVNSERFIERNSRHKIVAVELNCNQTYNMECIQQVVIIDSSGNQQILGSMEEVDDIKTIKVCFTQKYIDTCERQHIVSGVY